MPLYRDEALVLHCIDLGEADRIITLLTKHHGRVRAVAKGVRKVRSRFGGRLEPFMRQDVLIATGRSLDVVSQSATIAAYADAITQEYSCYIAANVIAEVAESVVATLDEPDEEQYTLAVAAISALARHLHHSLDITASYILRALALAGWQMRLDACVVCGRTDKLTSLSNASGGVMCSLDRTPDARHIDQGVLQTLKLWLAGNWQMLDTNAQEPLFDQTRHIALPIVEHWAQFYLEKPIRSARLLD